MRVEAPTGPFRQTALPGRESNPRSLDVDLPAVNQGWEDDRCAAPEEGGDVEVIELHSREGGGVEGELVERKEGGPGPS